MSTISLSSDFWTQDEVMELSPFDRLVLIGIATFCDEDGDYLGTAKSVKARLFPGDDITVDQVSEAISVIADTQMFSRRDDIIRFQDWVPFSTFPRAKRKRKTVAQSVAQGEAE